MNNLYRCWAEIDLSALRENLAWIRARVGPRVKIMTVVKADAYGHGLREIAALLMQSGTDVFGVANLSEARNVRDVGRGWPILMLGACLPDEVESAVRDGIMPTISTVEEARWFSAAAMKFGKQVRAHVKVDTGMGRLGVEPGGVLALALEIQRLPGLDIEGVFTHYAAVEDDAPFSKIQAQAIERVIEELRAAGFHIPCLHANSSGALLWEKETIFNMVRPGLLVYGVAPAGSRALETGLSHQLRPALSFKCRVSLVKDIPAGKTLSYGHTFCAPAPMRVATLTAGYGDGYMRAGSNRSQVLIQGRRCRILGRVTMDQMMADVTGIGGVRMGDEAVLIGRQAAGQITVSEVAEWFGTIPWEVFTSITHRVPRLYNGTQAS